MKRTYVRIKLTMQTGWRVGSWASQTPDVVGTLTDAANNPFVPGSGIAGALRREAGQESAALFGPDPKSNELEASPWWVLGTVVAATETEVRQRTRIDRERGSAAERGLFRAEEVERGEVTIYLRREHDAAEPTTEIVNPLVEVLKKWQPRIGGGKSIGMGRATITEVRHRTVDLNKRNQLLKLLKTKGKPAERVDALLKYDSEAVSITVSDDIYLSAVIRIDFLAVIDKFADRIHGSTWKGLLRSRVEYIGRSLDYPVCGTENKTEDKTENKWEGCGKCAVCRVFGSTAKPGIWQFMDSAWGNNPVEERQRIAIDRFTGGVRDGALWPQLYLKDVELKLVIRGKDPASEDEWVRLALLHALRDLDDGLIGVGPEGAAGYGTAKVTELLIGGKKLKVQRDAIPLRTIEEASDDEQKC